MAEAPHDPEREEAIAFVLELGRALHVHGAPAPRVEQSMEICARRLGLAGQFFATPTSLFASFEDPGAQRTALQRVEPGQAWLARRVRLEMLVSDVLCGRLGAREARREIAAIAGSPPPYPAWLSPPAYALASASAARFFGGGAAEVAASGVAGAAVGLLALATGRSPALARVFEPLAATIAAAIAVTWAASVAPVAPHVVTLGGLIVLLPGLALTTAMRELALGHLAAGTARLMGALTSFLVLAFGVALGLRVAGLFEPFETPQPGPLAPWTLWIALLVAPACFAVLLRARPRDTVWILAGGWIAFFGARAGNALLGPELGAFVGACALGLASNLYARLRRRPAVVMSLPGLLLLVPGSLGFQSLSSLIGRDVVSGVETAFGMTLVAVALVAGLLISDALSAPRDLEHLSG